MNKIKKIVDKYGYIVFVKLLFSPLFLIITTPFMMIKLWWNCRVLLQGKIDQYNRFSGIPAINCFFYWTQAYNLKKFGKRGISNLIGLGKFNLSKFFYVPRLGNFLFWKFSILVTLVSFIGFALSHCLWMFNSHNFYPIYITIIILFSVLLYSCIDRVNYNSLGWVFLPVFIWSVSHDNFLLSSIITGVIGVFSITVGVFAFIIGMVFYGFKTDIKIFYIMFPLIFISALRFYPSFKDNNSTKTGNVFINILKLIGVLSTNVKYKRKKKISILGIYFTILFSCFLAIALYQSNFILNPFLVIISVFISLLFLGESRLFRFADSHSYLISTWSVTAAYTITSEDSILVYAFLLVSNPIPLFGLFTSKKPPLLLVPERRPIFVGDAISKVREFLNGIDSGERILFQFDNPNGSYNRIFDGYRNVYELLLYCGNLQNLHIFPDWYFIQETNTSDGLEVWGRNLADVFLTKEKISFDYFIAYETQTNPLSAEFYNNSRISKIRSLNLSDLRDDFSPDPPNGMEGDTLTVNLYAIK